MRPAAAPGRVADWWPEWLRGWRADALIAVVAGAIQLVGTYFAGRNQADRTSLDALAYALLAAGPVALLVRRRFPVAVLLLVFATTLAYWTTDYPRGPVFIALVVAFITTVIAGYRAVAITMVIALPRALSRRKSTVSRASATLISVPVTRAWARTRQDSISPLRLVGIRRSDPGRG